MSDQNSNASEIQAEPVKSPVQFCSLHNQTSFSILDSLIEVPALFKRAKELGYPSVAITDHGSCASFWSALKSSRETGVKFIAGIECYFVEDAQNPDSKFRHLVLLAKNQIGYRNLLTLNKKAFDQGASMGKRVYPLVDWKLLEAHKEGLICLTACGNGILSQLLGKGKHDEAEKTLLRLKDLFGESLGIEVQPNNMKRGSNIFQDEIDQQLLNNQLILLGRKHGVRIVPTCNAHYLEKKDSEVHDVLLAIGSHQPVYSKFRLHYPVSEFYLKSGEEVEKFFARNFDVRFGEGFAREMTENSIFFSDLCEFPDWIDPKFSNPSGKELPVFPVQDEENYGEFLEWKEKQTEDLRALSEDKLFLRFACEKNFDEKLKDVPEEKHGEYRDRLAEEFDVIEFHGFSSYMLIVADYINWARKNEIAVGSGRGSAGGSLIAFLIGIHEADPIKYELIFARFHNKEKTSFPDIDTDFAPSGREKVQNYLRAKYGKDHVAHVSNVNTITPKVYVRDIARSCQLGGSREEAVRIGNDVADTIPADIKTIDDALIKIPLFNEYCKKYPEFVKFKEVCGKFRAWSTHAGGIVISARSLVGLVPLRKDKDGSWAIEYDKEKAEENGLIKMDTLGLSTLDIIGQAHELIKAAGKEVPEVNCDIFDQKAYDLISAGDTFGVFQLGTSGGTIDLCRQIKPKSVDDISAINSLARPSARDMRKDFIRTKNGEREFSLLDPRLQRSFGKTFGFGLYEESLMYLAQDIAGWSLNSADRLRKLTKEKGKNPKKVQAWRSEFISDGVKNGVNEIIATRIWDEVISLFGGYGFNRCLEMCTIVEVFDEERQISKLTLIKDVRPGDLIPSRDEKTGENIFVRVVANHNNGWKENLVEFKTISARVCCTMDHKFRTADGKMLPISEIIERKIEIVVEDSAQKIVEHELIGGGATFDLEIDHPDHQFYLANGVLTSNSHSVLYSMLSFKTAYLKAHFPIEFLLANLMAEVKSNSPDAKGNIEKIKKEIRKNKVKILAPDINQSQLSYALFEENKLLTGLDALKFVGDDAILDIIEKRPFTSFLDFMSRVDSRKVRANSIQALISVGCFDRLEKKITRKNLFLYVSDYRKKLQVWMKKHDPKTEKFVYPWPDESDWNMTEKFALEHHYMNEAFVCKPYEAYGNFFKDEHKTIRDIKKSQNKTQLAPVKGIVRSFFTFKVKKETSQFYGKEMVKVDFEDRNGDQCLMTIFPDRWERVKSRLKQINSTLEFTEGVALSFGGSANNYEDEMGIILNDVYDVCPPPSVPKDLKAKKINIRGKKDAAEEEKMLKETKPQDLFGVLEGALIDEGLVDVDIDELEDY